MLEPESTGIESAVVEEGPGCSNAISVYLRYGWTSVVPQAQNQCGTFPEEH